MNGKGAKVHRRRGRLIFLALLVPFMVGGYVALTPERKAPFDTQDARLFRVAGVRAIPGSVVEYVPLTLAQLNEKKAEHRELTFLLPKSQVQIPVGDVHEARVVEKGPDWQLVEYSFGNTYDSVSRYRAYRDRIEPISVRVVFSPGLMVSLFFLLLLLWVAARLSNWAWARLVRTGAPASNAPGEAPR